MNNSMVKLQDNGKDDVDWDFKVNIMKAQSYSINI